MDFRRNIKYFAPFSLTAPIIIAVIGLIMLLNETVLLGILFLAGGIGIIVLKVKGRVSDEEYDSNVLANLKDIDKMAMRKLGVDEDEVNEIAPIVFHNYVVDGYDCAKKGKDDKWRTNVYSSTTLLFSEYEVHCYTYKFNTIKEQKTEKTAVYFYKDIVSVSTSSKTIRFEGEDKDTEYECFELVTAGGTTLKVTLRDIEGAQRSINAMRQLLKQKKIV